MALILRHNSAINPRQNGLNLDVEPCPTVMTGGLSAFGDYWLEFQQRNKGGGEHSVSKPAYSVPTMDEVRSIPWNGLTVASTFSGAGGSCTGYRMAGYRVVWANEFVPIAQESYKANASPHCFLDHRDITTVTAEDILQQLGMEPGELDLFDGSPPCQAFSTAGQRDKGWGKEKSYEHGAKQCNEQLFDHYIRLLRGLQPKVFVAENVSGLVKGTAKGFFLEILAGLKAAGYKVSCKVLDAQWLGVPQTRTRTIFVGVRNDIDAQPVHPKPFLYRYSVRDALPHIGRALHDESGEWSTGDVTDKSAPCIRSGRAGALLVQSGAYPKKFKNGDMPSPAVVAGRTTAIEIESKRRKFTIDEVKAICAFPPDFILCGSYAQQWERLGNSVPPLMMRSIASEIRDRILLPLRASQSDG